MKRVHIAITGGNVVCPRNRSCHRLGSTRVHQLHWTQAMVVSMRPANESQAGADGMIVSEVSTHKIYSLREGISLLSESVATPEDA